MNEPVLVLNRNCEPINVCNMRRVVGLLMAGKAEPWKTAIVDHVIPRQSGGPYSWENLVAACPTCNRHKGHRALSEIHMQLRRPPFEPQPSAQYLYGRHALPYHEWARYLEGW